ncbi:MAG: hypothetical protein FWG22_03045, partial [Prolixibacteraceae bacterium]|nr:hypothetical protein [Prolixibacteraceae bacterium]
LMVRFLAKMTKLSPFSLSLYGGTVTINKQKTEQVIFINFIFFSSLAAKKENRAIFAYERYNHLHARK